MSSKINIENSVNKPNVIGGVKKHRPQVEKHPHKTISISCQKLNLVMRKKDVFVRVLSHF